jgi:hypothetical protein
MKLCTTYILSLMSKSRNHHANLASFTPRLHGDDTLCSRQAIAITTSFSSEPTREQFSYPFASRCEMEEHKSISHL